jgi:hypothetical protein
MSRMEESVRVADDDDAVANLVERRWFAAAAAVKTMQYECEVLHEVMNLAEGAWRHGRAHLAELETLRDALDRQLTELDRKQSHARERAGHEELSAA